MAVDVLVIGPHPDDIELSCGGTVARLVKDGRSVFLADLTQGELGTRGTRELRLKEAERAASILGVAGRRNLNIPDGRIENSIEQRELLIALIRELQPRLLFIPHSVDRHPDHGNAHHLCKDAWFYAGLEKIETTLGGKKQDPFRPDRYYEYMQWNEFQSSFICDITDTFEKKMEAVRAYASQFFDPSSKERETVLSNPDFFHLLESRARYYGQRIGVTFGEPFFSFFPVGVRSVFDLIQWKG